MGIPPRSPRSWERVEPEEFSRRVAGKLGDSADSVDVRNGTVHVVQERMPATNAFVSAPTVVTSGRVAVSGNSITVTVNWTNANDAYALTLTP